jgi:hypothetical protein
MRGKLQFSSIGRLLSAASWREPEVMAQVSHNQHEQHAHGAKPRHTAPLMAKKLRLVDIEVRAGAR